jgi:cytochrome b involved in lipid metabolism
MQLLVWVLFHQKLVVSLFVENSSPQQLNNNMATKTYTLEEVKKHKVAKGDHKDIWIVLHDKVYDVSKFLDEVRMDIT